MLAPLLEEIRASRPASGVEVWWLGQSGFVIAGSEQTVVVDPFLTDFGGFGRLYPPPFPPEALDFVDALLGTHDHADHIDPIGFPAVLQASPGAVGIVPAPILPRLAELGVPEDRLLGALAGRLLELGGLAVTPVAAFHADVPADGYGFHLDAQDRHPFLGYVLELDGLRICHTGDTCIYDGLAELLASFDLDLLLVPINGISRFREERGLVGNMNVFEAAELAERVGARLTVPIHWDLFADNSEDPEHFARYAASRHPGVRVVVPQRGVKLSLAARTET